MDNRDIYEYGWGLKGQRIYGQRPGKRRERISIMSGYHLGKLVAPFTGIGSCNLPVLIAWLTEMLLPTIGAGKKIVLDNASFHRCKLVRKVVEAAGCELIYLPKYSPALNPIEHPWHRIKQRVRKTMTSIAKHTKVDMIWVAGRSPTLVSQNLKATTLTYLAIQPKIFMIL
jgi:transposase